MCGLENIEFRNEAWLVARAGFQHRSVRDIEHSVRVRIPLLKAYVTRTTAETSLLGAFAAVSDIKAWLFGLVPFESTFTVSTSGEN